MQSSNCVMKDLYFSADPSKVSGSLTLKVPPSDDVVILDDDASASLLGAIGI